MKKSFLSHTMELTFHFQNLGLANPSVQIPPNEAHLWTCRDGSVILLSLLSAGLSLQLKGLQLSHSGKGPVHPHHLSKYIVEGEFDFFFSLKKKKSYMPRTSAKHTTMMTALRRRGIEKTKDMNMPLESKYWKFEKDLQETVKLKNIFLALTYRL